MHFLKTFLDGLPPLHGLMAQRQRDLYVIKALLQSSLNPSKNGLYSVGTLVLCQTGRNVDIFNCFSHKRS